jgi:hypothetical protein
MTEQPELLTWHQLVHLCTVEASVITYRESEEHTDQQMLDKAYVKGDDLVLRPAYPSDFGGIRITKPASGYCAKFDGPAIRLCASWSSILIYVHKAVTTARNPMYP